MEELEQAKRDVVIANRILAREGVVDAYGHVTVRHPGNPEHYLMSCSRSPELVTLDDIMEFTLDGDPIDQRDRQMYSERPIHGGIYECRPDVTSVVHNHAYEVIPFTITATPLRPVAHVAGTIGANVPVWDIRDKFGDTNLLVTKMEEGRDLAASLGDNAVVLMRGHGCAVSGANIHQSVMRSIYLQVNARLQMDAMRLGEVTYLSPGEIQQCGETLVGPLSTSRAWEYLSMRAGADRLF